MHAIQQPKRTGVLVVSLDFELHWGLRDITSVDGAYSRNLLGVRRAIPEMLSLFRKYRVSATWATVGFLFARNRNELYSLFPSVRPTYSESNLSPYSQQVGRDELDDPLHFAPSLIERIAETPGQEIGSHTLSHFYCLERGQTVEQFTADLHGAREVARARGLDLVSLVLPRNQLNTAYAPAVRAAGFRSFRGNQKSWVYTAGPEKEQLLLRRVARLTDSYLPLTGSRAFDFEELPSAAGLLNIRASHFLRPAAANTQLRDVLQFKRIEMDLEDAARNQRIFHLWWHPHNFGLHLSENLRALEAILVRFRELQQQWGLRSLSMGALAAEVLGLPVGSAKSESWAISA